MLRSAPHSEGEIMSRKYVKGTSEHARLLKPVNPAAGNMLALKWADERLYNLNLQIAIQEMIIERYSALHKLYSSCVNARLSQKDAAVEIALHRKRGAEILAPNFDALKLLKREREEFINAPLWNELGRKPKAEIIHPIAKPDMMAMFQFEE